MLVFIVAPLLIAVVGIGGPTWILVWELRKGRTIPPIRVELAKHPRWYRLCILMHAAFLMFMVLICGALLLLGVFSEMKVSGP